MMTDPYKVVKEAIKSLMEIQVFENTMSEKVPKAIAIQQIDDEDVSLCGSSTILFDVLCRGDIIDSQRREFYALYKNLKKVDNVMSTYMFKFIMRDEEKMKNYYSFYLELRL